MNKDPTQIATARKWRSKAQKVKSTFQSWDGQYIPKDAVAPIVDALDEATKEWVKLAEEQHPGLGARLRHHLAGR